MNPALPWWKYLALAGYYAATLPLRVWQERMRAAAGRSPVMVVYYHRVADDRANPWTCSNRRFEQQVRWMQAHFDLVSLEEAQHRIRSGHNRRPCVSITFDDGYAENLDRALPLLIWERIPCTYFVCNRQVMSGLPFPHDRELGQFLAPNSINQLRALALAGVEIGAHTRTHADLGGPIGEEQLYDEMVAARDELAAAIGQAIRYFAFPYGQKENMSAAAFRVAREAGYAGVCSAYGGYNLPGDDPFHLQRIPAGDQTLRLKNWLRVDPRKLRLPRYQVEETAPAEAEHSLEVTCL
ncbi:MAG: polysaccharide deacetylase family protein [Pirellulales bacterium]|jgi:peptidoglycan/xylan/chitin deacetylase (PgdA/CDA1 family)|nr:polysaccharide deacetylase family protein [Pirellulales bacterium]